MPALAQPYEPPKIARFPCAPRTRASSAAARSSASSHESSTNESQPRSRVGPGPRSSQPRRATGRAIRAGWRRLPGRFASSGDGSGIVQRVHGLDLAVAHAHREPAPVGAVRELARVGHSYGHFRRRTHSSVAWSTQTSTVRLHWLVQFSSETGASGYSLRQSPMQRVMSVSHPYPRTQISQLTVSADATGGPLQKTSAHTISGARSAARANARRGNRRMRRLYQITARSGPRAGSRGSSRCSATRRSTPGANSIARWPTSGTCTSRSWRAKTRGITRLSEPATIDRKSTERGGRARGVQPLEQRRVGAELAADPRPEPVRVVGATVRCTQGDAAVDPARAAELLQVEPRDQPAQAVADQVDAAAAHVAVQVLAQRDRGRLDPFARRIVERQDRAEPAKAQVLRQRQERGAVREIAVHQHDGALLAAARRARVRARQAERVERADREQPQRFLRDEPPGRRRRLAGSRGS